LREKESEDHHCMPQSKEKTEVKRWYGQEISMLAPYKQEKMVGLCKLANIFFHPHGGVTRCDSPT